MPPALRRGRPPRARRSQHLLGKRDKAWLVAHFKEPKKLVPGSKMPPFKFLSDAELSAMSDYLLALP